MDVTLQRAEVRWLAKPLKQAEAPSAPAATAVLVVPPTRESGEQAEEQPLPCTISVPTVELVDASESENALLNRHVTFQLLDGSEMVATHALKLRECLPVLAEGTIHWTQPVLHKDVLWELDVTIHVKTDRRPRALISHAITMKNHANSVARQLSLHKNKALLGLLPPAIGCMVGILATAPVWLPLTLLVGFMGSPIWLVVGVAASLVLVFSTVSAIVATKLVRSERVKGACQHFLRSPQGQLLLFQDLPGEQSLSPSRLTAQAREYVLANPSRKLVASLAIDFLGNATFVLPGLGEAADLLWAPVSAKMVDTLYSESSPHAKYVAFMEEVLPFTDFIPTATLAWVKENLGSEELDNLLSMFQRTR